ncbi:hypothetical protein KSP40_PGU018030 [Platanthera guangdongensis]|uniref:Uncharacterized protein n=1 Tax=Platanthera guangdongensis TaxID=2320717 RepID=A0ABR2M9R8_9ASPA
MVAGLHLHRHLRISKHPLPRFPSHTIHLTFPGVRHPHSKFCNIIPTFCGSRYLVSTTYFYGGVSGPDDPLIFNQIVDGTFWTIVNNTTDYIVGAASSYKGIFLSRGDEDEGLSG